MNALIFSDTLAMTTNAPQPSPEPGEALIRILMAGICNTDTEITKGYMGFTGIPGHEFVGRVETVNDVDTGLPNKRVVGDINCGCNRPACTYCKQGLGRHCPDRTTLGIDRRNGCFAEYITLPVRNLLEVPETLSNKFATLTEPLAAAFEILKQVDITPEHDVLIVGDGKLGLLISHALSTTGAAITHVGKHPGNLAISAKLGSGTILLHDMPDRKYDVVVEVTGNAGGFGFSVAHTKPRGTLILKSTIAAHGPIDLTPVVVDEITVIGSRCGLFQPALDYLQTGADLSPIIDSVYPFEKALQAFERAQTPGAMKVLLDFA
ncbi:MDR/zinc-dependent alcohol dehydrogenase-like family protein [Desulfoplanes sp.]